MTIHQFTVILADLSEMTVEDSNRLYEAGCDDSTPGSSRGVSHVEFHRSADTLEEAIKSAIRDVQKAGYRVARVECETINRINQQLQTA